MKSICLGITGGIAAYKAPLLARELMRRGFSVLPALTENGAEFVTPLTMETLTGHPCATTAFAKNRQYNMEHISLNRAADAILIAPATANIIGKAAAGIGDDLLSTVILAASCPVVYAPAMNTHMWENPMVQRNIAQLSQMGHHFISPDSGYLACGDSGAGRLAEITHIAEYMEYLLFEKNDYAGKRVVVTAGPTREMIDPVRFLSNRSSGKMGFAIAKAARMRGAQVTLIAGPNALTPPIDVDYVPVTTTEEMLNACLAAFPGCDYLIKAAAPSDFYVEGKFDQKIKKNGSNGVLTLTFGENPDILCRLGEQKRGQKLVGFAAETENLEQYAREKLDKKNLDMIVANDVTQKNAGFNVDCNTVTFFTQQTAEDFSGQKLEVAHRLLDLLLRC